MMAFAGPIVDKLAREIERGNLRNPEELQYLWEVKKGKKMDECGLRVGGFF